MNRTDFQRNYQWSYFGLIFTPKLREFAQQNGIDLMAKEYSLRYGDVIPCTGPQINAAETYMKVTAILPTKDGTFKKTILAPWKMDMDEDTTVMLAGVPVAGMVQGRHSVWYLSRVPVRDTPRGYCPKYTRFVVPNASVLTAHDVSNGEETLIPWKVYNKTYFSWQDACRMVEDGDLVGAALDKFLAVGMLQGSPYVQIFYKSKGAVGFVDEGQPCIYPDYATLTLKEYVRKIAGITPKVRSM